MSVKSVQIAIPDGVAFSDLKMARDPTTSEVSFDWAPIVAICDANGIDTNLFKHQHEDNVSGLIVAWYHSHRADGGEIDLVAEQLIAEVLAEDQFGEVNVISGAPKQ